MSFAPAAVAWLWCLASGLVVAWGLRLFGRPHGRGGLARWGLVPALGLGSLGCFSFLGLVLGWALPGPLLWTGWMTAVAVVLRYCTRGVLSGGLELAPRRRVRWLPFWLVAFGLVAVVAPLAVQPSTASPFGTGDAINIWNVRARVLLRAQPEARDWFLEEVRGHPEYPIGQPAAVAELYRLSGQEAPAIPWLLGGLLVLSTAALLYGELAGRSTGAALAVVATWGTLPAVWKWGFSQMADVWVGYFLLAAMALASRRLAGGAESGNFALALGFVLGALCNLKHEGIVAAALLVMMYGGRWLSVRGLRSSLREGWLLLAGGTMPLLALGSFKLLWASNTEADGYAQAVLSGKVMSLDRWAEVLRALGERFDPRSTVWLGLWMLLLVAVLLSRRSRVSHRLGSQRFDPARPAVGWLGATVLVVSAVYLLLYVTTPHALAWHLERSLDRLMLQLVPTIVLWAGHRLADGWAGAGVDLPGFSHTVSRDEG